MQNKMFEEKNIKTDRKYKEIWKVVLKSIVGEQKEILENQFILMDEKDIENWLKRESKEDDNMPYSIILTGGLWYSTEYCIEKVIEKISVNNLKDVIAFCEESNIEIDRNDRIAYGVLVGGEKLDLLNNDLELILDYEFDIEKDEWIKTDDHQWVKYNSKHSKRYSHDFTVVEGVLGYIEGKPFIYFVKDEINVCEDSIIRGCYEDEISAYYISSEDVIRNYPTSYPKIIAEILAETSNEGKIIEEYELEENDENGIEDSFYQRCEEMAAKLMQENNLDK